MFYKTTKLFTRHKNRVKTGKRQLSQADNRLEMLEAICFECHVKEHGAERIHQNAELSPIVAIVCNIMYDLT